MDSTGNNPSEKKETTLVLWLPQFIAWRVSRLQHREGDPKQDLEAPSVEETELRTKKAEI